MATVAWRDLGGKKIRIYGGHCCLILFFGGLTWVAGKIFEKQCRVSRVFLVPPFDGDTPTGPRRCVLKLFATEFEGKKHRDNKHEKNRDCFSIGISI